MWLGRELTEQRGTVVRSEGALAAVRQEAADSAGLKEQVERLRAHIRGLLWLRDALTLAQSELEAATREYQQAFAPRLEALVSESLSAATRSRYQRIRIAPSNLALSLRSEEHGRLVGPESLSTGTRDLVYLTLWLGIARMVSRSGESLPLLLDDLLIRMDSRRRDGALDVLLELGRTNQIILSTKEEAVRDWYLDSSSDTASLITLKV